MTMAESHAFDVVVVGAGIAGMVAGVRAAELGLKVAVLEKGETPEYPCNARFSGGIIHVAYHSAKLPPAELVQAIQGCTTPDADPALAASLADGAGRLIDWLVGHGVKFIRGGTQEGRAWMLAPPRPLTGGLDWKGRGPDVLLRRLGDLLAQFGGRLLLGRTAQSLLAKNSRCEGVAAIFQGQREEFRAAAVILADGGFQADLEMLRKHIAPAAEGVKQRGAATGTGDGLRMATAMGGASTGLDRFYGHLLCREAFANDLLWPYPVLDDIAVAGIMVDQNGQRFVDEGGGGIYMANIVAQRADPLSAAVIFDANIWDGPGRANRVPANPQLERSGATIHRGSTLEQLASVAGLPAAALVNTVNVFNQAVRSDTLAKLDPARTTKRYKALPIVEPPFYAIQACAGITYTMGGIKIDGDGRVMGSDGCAIDGLYAAGTTTGGLEGGERARYVGGLSRAGVFGMKSAEHIAHGLAATKR